MAMSYVHQMGKGYLEHVGKRIFNYRVHFKQSLILVGKVLKDRGKSFQVSVNSPCPFSKLSYYANRAS